MSVATAARGQPVRVHRREWVTAGDDIPRPSRSTAFAAFPARVSPAAATPRLADVRVPRRSVRPPRRRDRRGRGVRGPLAPVGVPLHRTRSEAFDDLVMDAVDEIEEHWAAELAALEFAVEDVPPDAGAALSADVVVDRGVALGRLYREGLPEIPQPVIVVYRRPIEARASDVEDRADLVFMVVVDLAAEFLGKDADEIDPY